MSFAHVTAANWLPEKIALRVELSFDVASWSEESRAQLSKGLVEALALETLDQSGDRDDDPDALLSNGIFLTDPEYSYSLFGDDAIVGTKSDDGAITRSTFENGLVPRAIRFTQFIVDFAQQHELAEWSAPPIVLTEIMSVRTHQRAALMNVKIGELFLRRPMLMKDRATGIGNTNFVQHFQLDDKCQVLVNFSSTIETDLAASETRLLIASKMRGPWAKAEETAPTIPKTLDNLQQLYVEMYTDCEKKVET